MGVSKGLLKILGWVKKGELGVMICHEYGILTCKMNSMIACDYFHTEHKLEVNDIRRSLNFSGIVLVGIFSHR
jgi:hypothetical protein